MKELKAIRVFLGFEPIALRHRPNEVSLIYGIFQFNLSKAKSDSRAGYRNEDLHLSFIPIIIRI